MRLVKKAQEEAAAASRRSSQRREKTRRDEIKDLEQRVLDRQVALIKN
jgi:hypothetical protein